MAFKLKIKKRDGEELDLDFELGDVTPEGLLIVAEDKTTGDKRSFLWRYLDPDEAPQ